MRLDGTTRVAAIGAARAIRRLASCIAGCVMCCALLTPSAARAQAAAPADTAKPAAEPGTPPADANAPADGSAAATELDAATSKKPDAPPEAVPPDPDSTPTIETEGNEQLNETGPIVDLSARLGSGFMRGGKGGLTTAQRDPVTLDVEVMRLKEQHWMYGGALRMELEDAKAVAGIARIALREQVGSLELRPGAGIPFYFAPRTMLGAEASVAFRKPLTDSGIGLSGSGSAAAFMVGSDIPHGVVVIMFHVFIGIDLLL
jgi:hypothetical protein